MELHSHQDTIESATVTHPILGMVCLALTFSLGIFSVATEQTLSDINLLASLAVKMLTGVSFILTIVIYWDKIRVNFKQLQSDVKEKLQRKK